MSNLGNKQVFSRNLRRQISMAGISPTILAEELTKQNGVRVPANTVYDWCNGVKYPRIDNIEMLANYFEILKSDLIEDKSDTMIPVLNISAERLATKSGATRFEDIDDDIDILNYEPVLKKWLKNGKRYFALILELDEMTPMFNTGDYVLFEYGGNYKNGDFCIIRKTIKNTSSCLFRRVSKENGKITITPVNYKYNTEVFDEKDIEIIAVAKERRTKLP